MSGISIALATYNGGQYLPEQLDSLARQTRLPSELVVSDDGSTDGTKSIVLDFARRAPFPVHFHENPERLGFRDNFMRAASLCTSGLVAFCDQDDVWEAGKLDVMERVFDDPDVRLAFHNATVVDRNGRGRRLMYPARPDVLLYPPLGRKPWVVVPGFTQVFRRDLARFSSLHPESLDLEWPDVPVMHDRWYFFLASVLGTIAYVPQPLARYRQHGANQFGYNPDTLVECFRAVCGAHFIRDALSWSGNRIYLLRCMRDRLPSLEAARVDSAIAYYAALRQRLSDRLKIYSDRTLPARLGAFREFARSGGYTGVHGSARFGWLDLLVDACVGVPFGSK